ncbi:hypothetical protein CBD41_06845 [bacterium TMED181]|nr:peptidase M16 [Planctomycetota bacterium]OUW43743.1 MAG: hypothetical protein CBD41_06845 [bacterium TMED181]
MSWSEDSTVLENATLREKVTERVHSSGARVAFCHKPGYLRTYACFATNFGSVDDRYRIGGGEEVVLPDGVAHFLEHKMFEGVEEDAFQQFSRLGASANAFTGFNGTSYLFSCTDRFYDCLGHLVRFVQSPHFTEENVEKEKGIIGQEIRMYEDMPGWRVYFNLLEGMYQSHPVSKDIAGTVETIAGITAPLLNRCWEAFYHPSNMILFAVGDQSEEEFFDQADRLLLETNLGPAPAIEKISTPEAMAPAKSQVRQEMQVGRSKLLFGWKDVHPGLSGQDLVQKELASDLALECVFGQSGALFEKLQSENLVDDSFGGGYMIYGDVGHSAIGGDVAEPEKVLDFIQAELPGILAQGIDEADIDRQRRATTGQLLRSFNSLENIAGSYCSSRFMGGDPFEVVDLLNRIKPADVAERLHSHVQPENLVSSIISPAGQ